MLVDELASDQKEDDASGDDGHKLYRGLIHFLSAD